MKYKLLLMTLFACGLGWGQTLVAGWTFDSTSAVPNTPNSIQANLGSRSSDSFVFANGTNGSSSWITATTGNELTSFGGDVTNDPRTTRVAGNALSFVGGTGNSANGKKIVFKFSMLEYENPILTFITRGTATGFSTHVWEYSTDNVTYSSISISNTANITSTWSLKTIDLSAINALDNSTFVYVRLTLSGASAAAGNNRIDNILINATPISTTYNLASWSNNTPSTSLNAIINDNLTTSTDLVCKDLTINSGKTLTIGAGNKLTVSGNLINNGTIVFKSTATSTAMFDTFSGTLSGSGVTTVERFIPARRAYRFLSPSVTTSTTIRQNWQEDGVNTPGFGTHITGATGASAGFDPTETNNSSLLLFTSGAWVGATSTNVGLNAGNAYCLMVRGDRTTNLTTNTPATSNTVLRATGTLFTGNFSPVLSAAASGYSFVGNPYQAPLDIKTALQSSTDVNKNVVYYWDPTINDRGGYITRNLQTSLNIPNNTSVNDYVQPGQAFFVVNEPTLTSAPALTFTENHKSVANAAAGVFRNANANEYGTLRVNLQANTNNQWKTIEGALAIFNDNFSWNVTSEDATKIANLDEDVSFVQNNTSLAIACQSNPSRTSELPLKIERMRHSAYQWQFELDNYEGERAYLFDAVNNSYTEITNGAVVPFTADANTTNRFKIVFQNSALSTDDFANNIKLYPNPAKAGGSFYIDGITEATVSVYNVVGQNIPVTVVSQGNAVQVTPIASLSNGVYLVSITTQGITKQVKWIVE